MVNVLKKEKTDGTRSFWLSRFTFLVSFFVSVGLIVGGFFVPPMGVIDGSVLTAIGEILLFPYAFVCVQGAGAGLQGQVPEGRDLN